MPLVGMRRTTRVFGMVKSYDGARVLRSGRRLWLEKSVEEANKLYEPIKKKSNSKSNSKDNCLIHIELNHKKTSNNAKETRPTPPKRKTVKKRKAREGETKNSTVVGRRFGIVYTRKRKRLKMQESELDGDLMSIISHSSGRESKSLAGYGEICESWLLVRDKAFAAILSKGFSRFSLFLYTILKYMTRNGLEIDELAGFLSSQPISDAYSSLGFHFSWDTHARTGLCKFFGTRQFVPLFSVDFSAVPRCFMYIHHFMLLRLEFQQYVLVNKLTAVSATNEITAESEEDAENETFESSDWFLPASVVIALSVPDDSENRILVSPNVKASRPTTRSSLYRNGMESRTVQKRRSSLRSNNPKNPALVSDVVSSRKNGIPFPSVVPNYKLRSSAQRSSSASNLKRVRSNIVRPTPNRDSSGCSANILIIESDKCYREKGASVVLEKSSSGDRFLVVKKNGVIKYTYKPQNNMRLPACNRVTHAMMLTVDDSWKLEFPNRQDWHIFKDLYKECADHNVPEPSVRVIPVPWVCEVSGFDDVINTPFHRPDSYICTNGDEVSRALAKTTTNYDVDSEDEEWLEKFNNNDILIVHEHVSVDYFELIVDSFEKDSYCSAEDFNDEKAAPNVDSDFGRREIVEAVYGYWTRKRNQRGSALIKVFQSYKRPSLLSKPPPRRKRSFKRQASQSGRTKLPSFLLAEGGGEAFEEPNAKLKVEEANESAECSIEEAIVKRQRAQAFLKNANLATYKAKMSLRIAEAAEVLGSTDAAVSHFLDL